MYNTFFPLIVTGLITACYSLLMGLLIGVNCTDDLNPDPTAVEFIGVFGFIIIAMLWWTIFVSYEVATSPKS